MAVVKVQYFMVRTKQPDDGHKKPWFHGRSRITIEKPSVTRRVHRRTFLTSQDRR